MTHEENTFHGAEAPRSTVTVSAYLAEHGSLPLPARAGIRRNAVLSDGQLDLGWHIDAIEHGGYTRPLLIESWAEEGHITCQTIFMSRIGLEEMTVDDMLGRFRASGAIVCRDDTPRNLVRIEDADKHPLWSFTLVVGVGDTLYVSRSFPFQRYPITYSITAA